MGLHCSDHGFVVDGAHPAYRAALLRASSVCAATPLQDVIFVMEDLDAASKVVA